MSCSYSLLTAVNARLLKEGSVRQEQNPAIPSRAVSTLRHSGCRIAVGPVKRMRFQGLPMAVRGARHSYWPFGIGSRSTSYNDPDHSLRLRISRRVSTSCPVISMRQSLVLLISTGTSRLVRN